MTGERVKRIKINCKAPGCYNIFEKLETARKKYCCPTCGNQHNKINCRPSVGLTSKIYRDFTNQEN